jgi:hypothetical protein
MQIPIRRNEGTMAGTAHQSDMRNVEHTVNRRGKNVHHGRTLAAWVGTIVGLVAFIIGGIAVVLQNWPMFWGAAGLAVIAVIVTVILQRMGYGAS